MTLWRKEVRVTWQRMFRARHKAKFKGFDESLRNIEWRDMVVSQFVNNQILEGWVVTDLAEQLFLSRT